MEIFFCVDPRECYGADSYITLIFVQTLQTSHLLVFISLSHKAEELE